MEGNPAPSLVVRIVSGPEAGRSLPLEPGRRIRIGRSPPPAEAGAAATDLVIDDRKLSRLHFEVRPAAGGWMVHDCGSSNGTFLNGERVTQAAIRPGDLVQAGSIVLELADPAVPTPPAKAPAPARSGLPLRRRPAVKRRSPLLAGGIALGLAAALIGAVLLLRGRSEEVQPKAPPPVASAPSSGRAPPAAIEAPPRGKPVIRPEQKAATPPDEAGDVPIEVVASFLESGEYRRALAYLDDLAGREAGFDPGPLRKTVLDRASADLAAAEKEATRLFRSGNAGAAEPLEEIALRIPDDLASDAAAALERVNGLGEALHDHQKKVEASASGVRAAASRLAFADAERLLGEMQAARKTAAGTVPDEGPGAASESALRREVQLAARAWKLLEAAIDGRLGEGAALRLSFAEPADAAGLKAGDYRIARRDGDDLALVPAGASKKAAVSRGTWVFSLDDRSLKALLGPAASGSADGIEGLAILLFYRSGPARAEAFARAERALDAGRREALLLLFETAGDIWLPARREAIAEAAARLAGVESKEPWEDLCRRTGSLARAWRGRAGYDRERAALADLFLQAKVGALKRDGLRGLFFARRAEMKGSRVKLEYDFSSDDQLRDFEKGLGRDSTVERDDGLLVLRGECRLFSGEPFEKSLTVRGKSPAGDFDPTAPNVAVGLFTREKDRLRIEGRGPTSLFALLGASNGPEPRDYVVFAIGYKTVVADFGGKPLESLYLAGQADPLPLPAHAVLFGHHRRPLHTDARECPWAVKAAPMGGPLSFDIAVTPDRLGWKLNGKSLLDGGPALERWADGIERIGSVTLLTRASEARLSALEVEGDLRDAWLAERLKGEALRAFREFDPDA